MHLTSEALKKMEVITRDNEKLDIVDFRFIDQNWKIYFIVVENQKLFFNEKKLVPTVKITNIDLVNNSVTISMSKEEVMDGIELEDYPTVAEEFEKIHMERPLVPAYGTTGTLGYPIGIYGVPGVPYENEVIENMNKEREGKFYVKLRSLGELLSYKAEPYYKNDRQYEVNCHETLIDVEDWSLSHIVLDKSQKWLAREKVIVSIQKLRRVSWVDQRMYLNLDRSDLEEAPTFSSELPVNSVIERKTYDLEGNVLRSERMSSET